MPEMSLTTKRKRDANVSDTKKTKNLLSEKERQEYATSNEWPVYNHPDGGTIKITPWGSLRQYQDSNGQNVTKFEDLSFQDYSFEGSKLNNIYEFMPNTPQSLCQNGSPSPDRIKLSPGDEAEHYVINGYEEVSPISENKEGFINHEPYFSQEHENYFGMEQQDDVDYNYFTDNGNSNDENMMT